jgi:hypothetical protein
MSMRTSNYQRNIPMLKNSKILLIAAALLGGTALASAYEAPENKIGDRYPFLGQRYESIPASKFVGRTVKPRQVARLPQYDNEAPENKIGDRYPFLDQGYQVAAESRFTVRTVMPMQVARLPQYDNEAPENKIGDRYPFLDQGYRVAAENRFVVRTVMTRQVVRHKHLTMHKVSKVSQPY